MVKISKIQNKLIRDNLPEFLKKEGIEFEVEEIKDEVNLSRLLLDKLEETAQDASLTFNDQALFIELANLETVIDGLLNAKGWSRDELKSKQADQDKEEGSYSKGLFLKGTKESDEEVEEEILEEELEES